mgnify:CR=1 FL=1
MIKRKTLGIKRRKPTKGKKRAVRAVSISKMMQRADNVFSIVVRRIGAWKKDEELWNKCFTSGYEAPVRKLQCGHYLSRWYKSARWDLDNARPQTMPENIFKKGNPIAFRENLIREIGEKRNTMKSLTL